MKRNRIIILTLLILIISAGLWITSNPKAVVNLFVDTGGLDEGQTFPAISGMEVEGEQISLDRYNGKPYLVMMAKIDCPVCHSTYPKLELMQEKYPNIPFLIIGEGTKQEYQNVKQEHNFSFPIIKADKKIIKSTNLVATPTFYLIGEDGVIEKKEVGFNPNQFEKLLKQVESNE